MITDPAQLLDQFVNSGPAPTFPLSDPGPRATTPVDDSLARLGAAEHERRAPAPDPLAIARDKLAPVNDAGRDQGRRPCLVQRRLTRYRVRQNAQWQKRKLQGLAQRPGVGTEVGRVRDADAGGDDR